MRRSKGNASLTTAKVGLSQSQAGGWARLELDSRQCCCECECECKQTARQHSSQKDEAQGKAKGPALLAKGRAQRRQRRGHSPQSMTLNRAPPYCAPLPLFSSCLLHPIVAQQWSCRRRMIDTGASTPASFSSLKATTVKSERATTRPRQDDNRPRGRGRCEMMRGGALTS